MINVQNCGVKPYTFMDGDRIIPTNNPTQKLYKDIVEADDFLALVDEVMDVMLKEEDKHYASELPVDVKLALMKDYFTYHREQMESRFPGSKSGQ